MRRRPAAWVALFAVLLPASLLGQQAPVDSVITSGRSKADTVRIVEGLTDTAAISYPRKSPGTAMLLSALLPGAGQFYNESYWKVPVIVGFGVYFAVEWISSNNDYRQYRDLYKGILAIDPFGERSSDLSLAFRANRYLSLREFYRDQRDTFTWYFLVLYLVNLADAYVDASLFDFNVGPNLALQHMPSNGGLPPLSLTMRFHF